MPSQVSHSRGANAEKSSTPTITLLTPKEITKLFKSVSRGLPRPACGATGHPTSGSAGPFATARPRYCNG